MADIQLNSVTLATESGGTVTVDSAVAGIPAAGVTGVLPVGVTGGSGLTALGTIAGNTTFTNDITANKLTSTTDYVLREYEQSLYSSYTEITGTAVENISGSNYTTINVDTVNDVIELGANFNSYFLTNTNYMGWGWEISEGAFPSATTVVGDGSVSGGMKGFYYGRHADGNGSLAGDEYKYHSGSMTGLASFFGLSASTTYRIRVFGASHNNAKVVRFGNQVTNGITGVHFSVKRWSKG